MLKFTLKDQSPFEYLQTNRVYINGKDKPCYVSIISKCLNLNNLVIPELELTENKYYVMPVTLYM